MSFFSVKYLSLEQRTIFNKGNNLGFDMTIKRCICRFKTLFLHICKSSKAIQLHTSAFEEALNYAPLRKTLRQLQYIELFIGCFSLYWDCMLRY